MRVFYSALFVLMSMAVNTWPFSLGVESISDSILHSLRTSVGKPAAVGLVTNQTGCDQQGNRTVDILRKKDVYVSHILAPEHGFDGKAPAGKPIEDTIDAQTNIPVVSVYGRGGDYSINGKRFDPQIMKQIDLLCYDLQDVGMRHYTYISTLLLALEAAAEHGKPIFVFDRPNLLGPHMEGPLVDPDPAIRSFISLVSIPLRHGMTVGELAIYFNNHILKKPAMLQVVKMKEYRRGDHPYYFKELSPNLKTLASCHGYSFLGILGEVSPFDVGVSTSYAFQMILLPDTLCVPVHIWARLRALLEQYEIRATHHELIKRNQRYCGLRLHFSNIMQTDSFQLLLDLLQFFQKAGIALTFSNLFDKAMGTALVRKLYAENSTRQQLNQQTKKGLVQFMKQAHDSFLYEPLPKVVLPA
jgi:uncharacterized protein YbbC (DUF1343 family)